MSDLDDFTMLNDTGFFDERWESDVPQDLLATLELPDDWDEWDEE